ncbi:unnamed protein product, partial [Prunus brigantina]
MVLDWVMKKFTLAKTIACYSIKSMKHWIHALYAMSRDGEAWKEFDRTFPEFAADPRNVRLGLATDGFNPYGVLNQHHSTWPIFVFPYNLPPWKCMKKEYMMLTVLITEDPGRSIDVYLRPPATHMNWTHKSMFFELPYWSKLKLRHNLDVMHVEKNVFDTLIGTILDIEGKTKDTIKARLDLERMGIRRVKPIMLLSRFFSQLTAKTLRKTDMHQLRHDIVQVLCKFEMIFPPAFFTSMIHVMVHLPEEALLAGPVNYRWMYPIERAKPEGSIIEAWVQYESLTFCGMYLQDVDTAFNRPQRNNDGGVRNEKLSVFAQRARPFGDPVRGESFSRKDMEVAHWFVLNNCDEIMTYLNEHEEMMKREHPSHFEELYNLAFGPIRAELFSGCHVNGIKFLGAARDDKLCTQNSGVHVPGGGESTDIDFYGKLTTVVQLLYKDRYQVIMFKCQWFDTNPNRQGSVK